MSSKLLSLKWNNHNSAFLHRLKTIKSQELYSDATLACDGRFYPVHKLVLSTCSDYFEQMFERTACKHPVVVLKDVRCEDVEALLNYMYVGEVDVVQGDLARIIKAAECLRIKGLAVPDEPSSPHSHNKEGKRSLRSSSPAEDTGTHNKRARREDSRRTPDGESEGGGGGGRDRLGDDQSSEKEEIVPDDDDDAYSNKDHHPGDQDSAFDPIILVKEEPSEGKQEIYSEETLLQVGLDNHIFKSTPPFPRPYPQRDSIQTWEPPLENPPPDGNVAYVTAADFAPHQLSASQPGTNGGSVVSQDSSTFMCPYCSRSTFRQLSDLKRHMRIHTGDRPYQCPMCPYSAARRDGVNKHFRRIHGSKNREDLHQQQTVVVGTTGSATGRGEEGDAASASTSVAASATTNSHLSQRQQDTPKNSRK